MLPRRESKCRCLGLEVTTLPMSHTTARYTSLRILFWPEFVIIKIGRRTCCKIYLKIDDFGDAFFALFFWIFSLFHLHDVLRAFHDVLVQVVDVRLQVLDLK